MIQHWAYLSSNDLNFFCFNSDFTEMLKRNLMCTSLKRQSPEPFTIQTTHQPVLGGKVLVKILCAVLTHSLFGICSQGKIIYANSLARSFTLKADNFGAK